MCWNIIHIEALEHHMKLKNLTFDRPKDLCDSYREYHLRNDRGFLSRFFDAIPYLPPPPPTIYLYQIDRKLSVNVNFVKNYYLDILK